MTSFVPGRVPAVMAPAGSRPAMAPPGDAAAARRRRKPARLAVPACYLLAACVLTWRLWADPASRMTAGNAHDADLFAWFMRYAAEAVRHGQLPALVTTGMNAPAGVNLMWNTPVLPAGILLAPVTWLLGPQTSLTILTTAGFAGSATALYGVLRRRGVSTGAAGLAGAVYGFSPALLQSAMSHFALLLAILPPLLVETGLTLAIGPPARPGRQHRLDQQAGWLRTAAGRLPDGVLTGCLLGVLLAGQLFTGEELALWTAVTGVLFAAALAVSKPRAALSRIRPVLTGLLTAAVVTVAMTGSALRTQFGGPLAEHGAVFPPGFFVTDLTGFVTPQRGLLFHTAASAAEASRYQGGAPEYLSYLGWPLIAALLAAAVISWRRPAARAAAVTAASLWLLSLGGQPLIGGHPVSGIYLPWHWIQGLPVIASALPDRLSILADGTAAVLLALGIDEACARFAGRPAPATVRAVTPGPATLRSRALILGAAALCCLPLVPRPLAAARTAPVPPGWSAVLTRLHLAAGTAVLAVPLSSNVLTLSMRWSAETGAPGAMIGGYFLGPGADGKAAIDGQGPGPAAADLNRLWAAGLPPDSPYRGEAVAAGLLTAGPSGRVRGPALPLDQALGDVSAGLTSWQPGVIVADATAASPLGRVLTRLLGPPSAQAGQVTGWRMKSGPGTGQ